MEEFDINRFKHILETDSGERKISSFLKRNPKRVYWTFCKLGGHTRYLFKEFTLGSSYKCDFVLLNSYSGTWEAYFIELEPIKDIIFTKDKRPSKRLSIAIRQIDDWKNFIENNKNTIRKELVKWTKNKDTLCYSDPKIEPCNYSGDILADPSSPLFFEYYIIIGQRKDLDKEKRILKSQFWNNHLIEIGSYDRFLDLVEVRYKNNNS